MMTTHRRTNSIVKNTGPLLPLTKHDVHPASGGMSLMDKWRERRKEMSRGEAGNKGHYTMIGIICFHTPTYIYVMMNYIVPHFFDEYHPWTQYYIKVFLWFILMNVLVNYLCTVLYKSFYIQTKDNPYMVTRHHSGGNLPETFGALIEQKNAMNDQFNGRRVISRDGEPDWSLCDECDVYVPPRTYHCRFCKKCVLKRDHHCFIVGCCVGFKNQRYFIVMLFYCLTIGMVGECLTMRYIQMEVWPTAYSWTNFVLPITVVRWGWGSLSGFDTLLIVHCYIYALYILLGTIYFPSQMSFAMMGKTMLEVAKELPITNFNTRKDNLTSVFGDCWILNFVFPMVLVFRQRDDGVHWEHVKIDYNSNNNLKNENCIHRK